MDFTPEGEFTKLIGTPGAGPEQERIPLPPEIVRYLLTGKGSISGLVWNDINGNRVVDTGEPGVQGIRVYVDTDNSGTFTFGDKDRLTDADGVSTWAGKSRPIKIGPNVTESLTIRAKLKVM